MKLSRRFGRFEDDSWRAIHNSMSSPKYDLRNIHVPIRMQRGARDRLMINDVSLKWFCANPKILLNFFIGLL
jgi:hypothetical protein